jgi:hypothetical protein
MACKSACVRALTDLTAAREEEDYVLMRPMDTNNPPYVARMERMESDECDGCRWIRSGAAEPHMKGGGDH